MIINVLYLFFLDYASLFRTTGFNPLTVESVQECAAAAMASLNDEDSDKKASAFKWDCITLKEGIPRNNWLWCFSFQGGQCQLGKTPSFHDDVEAMDSLTADDNGAHIVIGVKPLGDLQLFTMKDQIV